MSAQCPSGKGQAFNRKEHDMQDSVFQGRHLLSTRDFTKDELMWLIGFAEHLKDIKKKNMRLR